MSNDKMHEEFEVWAIRDASECGIDLYFEFDPESSWYIGKSAQHMNLAWAAWQASRAAVVVELPQIVGYEAGYDSIRDNDFAALPDELFDADEVFALHRSIEVTEAIEAAGLKVAP